MALKAFHLACCPVRRMKVRWDVLVMDVSASMVITGHTPYPSQYTWLFHHIGYMDCIPALLS